MDSGIKAYPIIGPFQDYFADSLRQAQRTYKEEEILAFQVELLRRFRPLVVIGHDINGEYGHGVHMLNAYTLQKALELSNDPQAYPESARRYGLWDVPKTYLHLWPENPILLEWDQPLTRFGGRTGYEMAIEGFACHVSQQNYFSVRKRGVHDCRAFGLYRSDRGPDLNGDDFMEDLPPGPGRGKALPPLLSCRNEDKETIWSVTELRVWVIILRLLRGSRGKAEKMKKITIVLPSLNRMKR